jgi:alkylation response protein AidB-like acyl-CoA dehydrogenase
MELTFRPRGESVTIDQYDPAALDALLPELSARAAESETARRLPADLTARMKAAGAFDLLRPQRLGGLGLDAVTFLERVETVTRADSSAGFVMSIANAGTAAFAWLDPDVAAGLVAGAGGFSATSTVAPFAPAVPDGNGGLIVSGRWPFNTGCHQADWFEFGIVVLDGDRPRQLTDGRPDLRIAFVRADPSWIVETWDAAGLAGTGSDDVEVRGLRIPEEHTMPLISDGAQGDGPLARIPFTTGLVALAALAFPLGVARRALDEFVAYASTRTRGIGAAAVVLAQDGHLQIVFGQAEGDVQAARAFAFAAANDVWVTASAGDVVSAEQLATLALAANQAMRACVAAVNAVHGLSGASVSRGNHPLGRCFRDINVARQHFFYNPGAFQRYAQAKLAHPPR